MDLLENGIAVIGIACRFPGAKSKDEFWENLIANKESIKRFSDEELKEFEFDFESIKDNPNFVKARGVIEDIDKWDAKFFNINPKDAKTIDPQQRLWLSNTWHAFEDSGIDPFNYKGIIGVYAGSFFNTYLLNNVLRDPVNYELYLRGRTPELFQTYINSDPMFLATKTAYHFNLRGAAMSIQTACSTSLVAIAQACNSLLAYESDVCVSGGVTITSPEATGYMYQEGGIGSPDGHCKPFDINGKGTVFGNGVGTVILKRLKDAIEDNDRIYSVIRGWATNNDGNLKVGFTAPSIDGQYKVITSAQSFAEVKADDFQYIEAHGTATPLGDPIEVTALTKAFRNTTDQKQFCAIGSVKSNIGHLDAAAGVASLIKVSLSAYFKKIPATLHYTEANPRIDFKNSPFYVLNKNLEWNKSQPLIMGVSSFGVGGTNAHLIVQDYHTEKKISNVSSNAQLAVLSAKSEWSLNKQITNLVEFIKENPSTSIADIAYTLMQRRSHMQLRSFAFLEQGETVTIEDFVQGGSNGFTQQVAFMFPGQGAQYLNMGHQLYLDNDTFKKYMDICFLEYKNITNKDLKDILFDSTKTESSSLNNTEIAQPALFIIEYALGKLYLDFGISPDYMIGHSIGEYAAACLSGVFELESALKIVIKRGQLMQSMPLGKMIAVFTSEEKLKTINSTLFEIAAINATNSCTISVKLKNYEDVIKELNNIKIQFVELNTSHAFHSSDFDPIINEFKEYVSLFEISKPEIPFISCVTGDFITDNDAKSAEYWARQLRATVQFNQGIEKLANQGDNIYVEVGPNTHLSGNLFQNDVVKNKECIIKSIGKTEQFSENKKFYFSLGKLWMLGQSINEKLLYGAYQAKTISLPNYPFNNKRYWIDINSSTIRGEYFNSKSVNEEESSEISLDNVIITVKEKIKKLISSLSGYSPSEIIEEIKFVDMGFDSLFLAQLAGKIEHEFNLKISFKQLSIDYQSVDLLTDYIEKITGIKNESRIDKLTNKEISIPSEQNFVTIQPNGTQIPIIFLHGERLFNVLPDFLGENQPFYGFLHLGSDGEKVPFNDIKIMAKAYLKQLLKQFPQGPFILGGYSIGGILAYEMAILLQEMGHNVPKLIMLDSNNPAVNEVFDWKQGIYKTVRNRIIKPIYYYIVKLHYVGARSKIYFLLKKPIPVKKRRNYIFSIYFYMVRKYNYMQSAFKGDVILFKASENDSSLKYLGWDNLAKNINLITVKGNHESFLKEFESNVEIKEALKGFILK